MSACCGGGVTVTVNCQLSNHVVIDNCCDGSVLHIQQRNYLIVQGYYGREFTGFNSRGTDSVVRHLVVVCVPLISLCAA